MEFLLFLIIILGIVIASDRSMSAKYLEINYAEIKNGNSNYTNPNVKLKPASWLRITAYINAAWCLFLGLGLLLGASDSHRWAELAQALWIIIYAVVVVFSLPTFIGMIKYLRHSTQGDMSRLVFVLIFILNVLTILICALTYAGWYNILKL